MLGCKLDTLSVAANQVSQTPLFIRVSCVSHHLHVHMSSSREDIIRFEAMHHLHEQLCLRVEMSAFSGCIFRVVM
jgi:hypothetical protein